MIVADFHGQVSGYQSRLNGSCPSFKMWSWTIYSPSSATVKHGGSLSASAGSFATTAAPAQLDTAEYQYCIRLGDWWAAVLQEYDNRVNNGTIIHIGAASGLTSASAVGRSTQRLHRLIKGAHPSQPPGGYFDCTVEVRNEMPLICRFRSRSNYQILHGHKNDNGVYSLYVTDYTANENLSAIDANWCRPSLAHMVLRMEMWNEAAPYAETDMKKGDYFSLPNARVKLDGAGFMEGTISEVRKFRKLDVDELEDSPHLAALLEYACSRATLNSTHVSYRRKRQWEMEADAAGTNEFPHRLFKDADALHHFKCTVQVRIASLSCATQSLIS